MTSPSGDDELHRLQNEVEGLRAVIAAATDELERRTDEVARYGVEVDACALEIARLEALVATSGTKARP